MSVHVIARLHEDLDLFAGDGGAPVEAQPAVPIQSLATYPCRLWSMNVGDPSGAARNVDDFPLRNLEK